MATGVIPTTRDNALYSAALETLRRHPGPISKAELLVHKGVAPHLEKYPSKAGKIRDVLHCLSSKGQIQLGYETTGQLMVASIDKKDFPYAKDKPNKKTTAAAAIDPATGKKKRKQPAVRIHQKTIKYSDAVEKVLLESDEPLMVHELKAHKDLKQLFAGLRESKISEVLKVLKKSKRIQTGYTAQGNLICTVVGRWFGYPSEPPRDKSGKVLAGARTNFLPKLKQPTETPAPEAPAEPITAAPETPALPVPLFGAQISIDALARQFAMAVASHLSEQIVVALNQILPAKLEQIAEEYKAATPVKQRAQLPKVIIAGLLPQQAGLMVQEYGKKLDFAFIETTEASNSKRIDALLASHDYVYAMTSFMSHSLDGKLKHATNFHRISGGLTQLRAQLTALVQMKEAITH